MNHRFWLFRRNGVFYLQDAQTRHKESLHTRNRDEARRLRDARNDAADRPTLGIALAKAYLAGCDPALTERTWQAVMEQFCSRGNPETQADRRRVTNAKLFDRIRRRRLVETTAADFLAVLEAVGIKASAYLRCLHNLAQGLGWLLAPVLAPKMWPVLRSKSKRGITEPEHQQIIAQEKNLSRRLYYELLWETGASQTDAALLRAENIDWPTGVLAYQRKKTGEWSHLRIGKTLEQLLRQLPSEGFLFPGLAKTGANSRASEFHRRCRLLGIKGISLHCYRYAWTQRTIHSYCLPCPSRLAGGHPGALAVSRGVLCASDRVTSRMTHYGGQEWRRWASWSTARSGCSRSS